MKAIRSFFIGTVIAGSLAASLHFLHAQETAAPIQTTAPDSIVQLMADSLGLPPVAPEALPRSGTFFLMVPGLNGIQAQPYPCPPGGNLLPTYSILNGVYLVDGTAGQVLLNNRFTANSTVNSALAAQAAGVANLVEQIQGAADLANLQMAGGTMAMDSGGGMYPNGSTNIVVPLFSSPNIADYGTNLWIAQFNVLLGNMTGVMSNTQPGIEYEIQASTDLSQNNWISEGLFPGSQTTNWTPFSVAAFNLSTNVFLRARSWVSNDGSGLPDWWELQYFGHTDVDPDSDPMGDGTTVWENFEKGLNPTIFNFPSAINNVQILITGNHTATLTWSRAPGLVISYTIYRYDNILFEGQFFTVAATNLAFTDTNFISYPAWNSPIDYFVSANYATGNSGSGYTSALLPYGMPTAKVLMGSGGATEIAAFGIPVGASALEITRLDWNSRFASIAGTNTFFVPASAFANGAYIVPTNLVGLAAGGSDYYVQTIWSNGVTSIASQAASAGYVDGKDNTYGWGPVPPFFTGRFNDGSVQMEQNAIFLLRAAGLTNPFVYSFDPGNGITPVEQPANYAFASYWAAEYGTCAGIWGDSSLEWSLPFQENYQFRNFVFSTINVNSAGFLNTGADANYALINPTTFAFPATNTVGLPALLDSSQTTWMVPYTAPNQLGITTPSGHFYLPNNIYNYFGLKLLSVMVAHNHQGALYFDTLNANGYLPRTNDTYYFYPRFDQPNLQTIGYYFGRTANNYATSSLRDWLGADPLPGDNSFSPTNTQPLLIGTIGTPMQVAAFARQTILNGDTTKPVYVAQYFDKSYKVDANGRVTTNETGVLSPYGDFLPTEPGPAALVTLPSFDGQRGTGVVYVASVQLDVNHDGNMDMSLFAPDSTWNTMNFWVNELYDQPGNGSTLDQDLMVNLNQGSSFNTNLQPNYVYQRITCQRDLENFARLWIRGLPQLPASQGYSVTLNLDTVPWNATSAINLYQAVESDGGIGYLTDTNIAAAQVTTPYGSAVAQLMPWGSGFNVPRDAQGKPTMTNFLFEGSAIPGYGDGTGVAGILLTVSQNGQPVAQTEVYVNFSHVRDMYERAVVTNVIQTWPEMVQQPETSGFEVLSTPAYNAAESKQLAVFVHGWRMTAWDWERFSATMFKRLYWQGFQGRFASLRWPTRSADTDTNLLFGFIPSDKMTYNRSEHIAFESGTGAAAYFNNLRQRFTNDTISVCSHSMGGIVMMEALKELAGSSQSPLDNYVLMQAAVPAHCYDTSVTNLPFFEQEELLVPTPDAYANYATGITNALRGKIINFYNSADFALQQAWVPNEGFYFSSSEGPLTMKPNTFLGYSYNSSSGVAQVTTNSWQIMVGATNVQPRIVTEPLELMPFVARPRSLAVGAQGNIGQTVNGGQLDLTTFGFADKEYDHSGEFNRNIQTLQVNQFYFHLLNGLTKGQP
jgi:pimeloyl-ACP methyl ester carboxylesterase